MTQQTPDWLAKDALDIGIFTNQLEPMLDFYQNTVGLSFDHMLPVGGGVRQHRHDHQGSVFKLNHSRDELAAPTKGGYLRIIIALPNIDAPRHLTDPDGNSVHLVPIGHEGIHQWAIEVATGSEEEFLGFYRDGIGLPVATEHPLAVRVGRSLILGRIDPELAEASEVTEMKRKGIRYTTLQVFKVDKTHSDVLAAGGTEGSAPVTLGETARISFVRDRRGNWMELSQRASITGSLEA